MKKLLYISFFAFCYSLFTFDVISQPSNTWQWLYPGPYDDDDTGYDICSSTDGNFFLVGGATGFNYFPNFYVKKINQNGNVIWSRAIGGTGRAYAVAPTFGGGCVAIGDAARFLKFDANGDTIVNKVLIDAERRLVDIKRTFDNSYISCGRYNIDNATIIKFDSLGNVLWERIYITPYIKRLYSVEEAIDGGYIAVGRNQNFFGDTIRLLIIKVGENGDSLWEKEYASADGNSITKLNNTYVISGGRLITKINILGIRYTSFLLDSLTGTELITDMKLLSPNRFVYSTNILFPGDVRSKILLSDSVGNIIRIKKFNFSNNVYLNELEICPNADIISMGEAGLYDTSSKALMYALRTDSLFNVPPIGVIGITQINNSVPINSKLYQNYPNPLNPVTTIKYDIPHDNFVSIKIYDLIGREIFNSGEFKKAGSYEVKFDGTNLASGMYFYSLESKDFKDTKKMVLLK